MTKKFDVYEEVTTRIIEALEAGTPPWRKPWTGSTAGLGLPIRATGEHYQGINVLMLWLTAMTHGYTADHWFTYRQAQERGGQVRKGEKSALVVKYGTIEREDENGEDTIIPFARAYRVFNSDQIDGLPDHYYARIEEARDLGTTSDPELDAWFSATGLRIETSNTPAAYYDPMVDRIHMPPVATFYSAQGYYDCLAHECIHAVGHRSRLDRFSQQKTKQDQAFEELIAEIGGAMVCASLGMTCDYDQNAAYVSSWVKALRDDKRAIFRAASLAQKAFSYLHDMNGGELTNAA